MEKSLPPIPALYACYLLRSTIRHASLYVGSTPHPVRRLKQHNGLAKGGAARTSRDSLRPWEVTCLVTGFPSKIAALQFEWAWQNPDQTRHLAPSTRLAQAQPTIRFSPKTGRMRKRPTRPRLCLTERLANLHSLLRASSFSRWPLTVTFYADDVFKVWKKWTGQHLEHLPPSIQVAMDDPSSSSTSNSLVTDPPTLIDSPLTGIAALDVTYAPLKTHISKTTQLLETSDWLNCSICNTGIPASGAMTLVCPNETCNSLSHLNCLSSSFLQAENNPNAIVPTHGTCPTCNTNLHWVDLVKELTLRMRGDKIIQELFKVRRRAKKGENATIESTNAETLLPDHDESEDDDDEDDWHVLPESSDVSQPTSPIRTYTRPAKPSFHDSLAITEAGPAPTSFSAGHFDPVIEDSDWDDAEILS
ncbi:Structure-specific endonuclease subunit slx1 [Acrodontium crateriforme]|uniref:Structure-specific endonuclease subunit slx1 n=1 Tax=Acrodontium crateriforme TaxID=150365 RepID=A0AAQ3RBS6_9PEZI|nr:Structure-specific endonuclease subunit slx1 [Acrodontium crateriforme]